MRLACRYLCKQFDFNYKRVSFLQLYGPLSWNFIQTQELQKYLLEFDVDNDGMLDFEEFKIAIKTAQQKLRKL